ncbi:MAG TPA: thioredoxin domain-containing protein, partial [Candidatus Babeliaceae bacterium]|nr:thioredoxin domain-containing protein [Candidatus Babeliaceae bacterium]
MKTTLIYLISVWVLLAPRTICTEVLSLPANPQIETIEAFHEVIADRKLVIVKFYLAHCPPCKKLSP